MANKIRLSALGVIEEIAPQYVQIGEAVITVERFIPYEKMLDMVQWCIDYIINDRPFISAPLKRIIKDFAILNFFTNIDFNFLDEYHDMADIYEEYDFVARFGVMEKVKEHISPEYLEFFDKTLDETLESITAYRNSAVGVIDALSANAKNDTAAMEKAMEMVGDEQQMAKIGQLLQFAQEIQPKN